MVVVAQRSLLLIHRATRHTMILVLVLVAVVCSGAATGLPQCLHVGVCLCLHEGPPVLVVPGIVLLLALVLQGLHLPLPVLLLLLPHQGG